MPSEGKKQTISSGEYEHLCEIGVAFEGIVEGEDGEQFYVYCEAIVIGYFENRHNLSYETSTRSHEIPICPRDNTYVDTRNWEIQAEANFKRGVIQNEVKQALINKLSDYSKRKSRHPMNDRLTNVLQQIWNGTPTWPKAVIGSGGGRFVLYEDE